MPIFNKNVEAIGLADLKALVDSGAVESMVLECKSQMPERDAVVKTICAFANTYGGYILIGVSTLGEKLAEVTGIPVQNNLEQTVTQWTLEHIYPPPTVFVSPPIMVSDGCAAYVIYIPASDAAPHFITNRRGIFVRVASHSREHKPALADADEVRLLLDRRSRLLERRQHLVSRARERYRRLVREHITAAAYFDTEEVAGIENASLMMINVVPAYPMRRIVEASKLRASLCLSSDYDRAASQEETIIVRSNWRMCPAVELTTYGSVQCAWMIMPCRPKVQPGAICLTSILEYAVKALFDIAPKTFATLGYEGPIHIAGRLTQTTEKRLTFWVPTYGSQEPYEDRRLPQLDDEVSFSAETLTHTLAKQPIEPTVDLLEQAFFGLGAEDWAEREQLRKRIESLRSGR